ncbi:hypothetical protein ZWY2020_000728 [Hordeum vulgare]|nr:hypothetical protein ZWY2020_000728 [Hordeum vulgare]
MPASALPRGVQSVLVTSGQLRNLDPQLHVPPLLLANTLNAAFSRAALPRLALPLLRHILRRAHPFRPDAFTFPPLVRAAPGHASAAQLHACALRLGLLRPCVFASGSLVHAYLRFGRVSEAYRVFDEMPERDLPAWNAMLSGLCRNARAAEAVRLFGRMVGEGVAGDTVTVSSVLPMCAMLGDWVLALVMHVYAVKHGLDKELFVCNAMVGVYGKLDAGRGSRCLMEWSRDLVTEFDHLRNGLANEAIEAYSRMQKHEGLKPIQGTIVSVLPAYSQLGALQQGMRMHALSVKTGFNLDVIHGNVEMGKVASQNLFELDPENVGYYVLMSNMYAKVGKWDGVDEVRSLVRHQNLQKTPGWSSVEVKRSVNVFYSGNQTEPHPQHEEIQAELQNLLAKMRTIEHVTAQLINREAQQRGPSLPERPHDAARILHAPTPPTAPPPPSPPTSLPSGRIGETSSPASRRPLLPRRPRATAAALRVRAPGQPQPRASAQESKFH